MEKKNENVIVQETLNLECEGLELFAEEIPTEQQKKTAGGKTLSTLASDCGLSTFGCLSGTFAA
jgi:hypothetical protein